MSIINAKPEDLVKKPVEEPKEVKEKKKK